MSCYSAFVPPDSPVRTSSIDCLEAERDFVATSRSYAALDDALLRARNLKDLLLFKDLLVEAEAVAVIIELLRDGLGPIRAGN